MSVTQAKPLLLGLTGSIGMGKTTIASFFRDAGIAVWDADAAVHRVYDHDVQLQAELHKAFGDVIREGKVDRAALGDKVRGDDAAFKRLNALVHPAIVSDRTAFLLSHADDNLVVLDIPLLFETGGEARVDKVLVVSAPAEVQRQRVMTRPGMTEVRFVDILNRQISDAEKRQRADFVIDTSKSLEASRKDVDYLIRDLTG